MLRPSVDDFLPGRHYGNELPREQWEWPIQYEDLAPWYDEAERLFAAASDSQDSFRPLEPPCQHNTHDVLPMADINLRLIGRCRTKGLRPFRLPLAIDRSAVLRAYARIFVPARCSPFRSGSPDGSRRVEAIRVMTNTDVLRLETNRTGQITGVSVRPKQSAGTMPDSSLLCSPAPEQSDRPRSC
ncbi:MAG: hypothetical protein R3C19_11395 [Planctomycetaceae bacterium]